MTGCRRIQFTLQLTLVVTVLFGAASRSDADEFLLDNGATIQGKWLNRDRRAADPYIMRTKEGVKVAFDRRHVREAHRVRSEDLEYKRIAPTYPDTANAQWQLAEWCRKNKLLNERTIHLDRVLKLDPDHHEARYAAGFRLIRGKWMTVAEFRRSKGYERYEGTWRLAQEIELEETRRQKNRDERAWSLKLSRWREDLETRNAADAAARIVAVRDKHAVLTLREMLLKERSRAVKMLYVEALAKMNTTQSIGALVVATLHDPDEEIFYEIVRRLAESDHPEITEVYATTLTDPNNIRVNRAAIVLGELNATDSIEPLIEALQTTHTVVTGVRQNRSGDTYSASFGKPGNGPLPGGFDGNSFSAGNGAKTTNITVRNQEVLNALVGVTGGVNFGFDEKAWRHWHSSEQRKLPALRVRRD